MYPETGLNLIPDAQVPAFTYCFVNTRIMRTMTKNSVFTSMTSGVHAFKRRAFQLASNSRARRGS